MTAALVGDNVGFDSSSADIDKMLCVCYNELVRLRWQGCFVFCNHNLELWAERPYRVRLRLHPCLV